MTGTPLKPCPFCGGPGILKWDRGASTVHWIECETCGAKGQWAHGAHGGSGEDQWNTRHIPAITDEDVERAAEIAWNSGNNKRKLAASVWTYVSPAIQENWRNDVRAALTAYLEGKT